MKSLFPGKTKNTILKTSFTITPDQRVSGKYFSLFLRENLRLWYLLEAPQRRDFNEYPKHMVSWRNKKNINAVWLKNALSGAIVY